MLLLPFVTVLLFGTLEVSYYLYNEHQVIKGVRDGARYASRLSFTDLNCSGGSASSISSDLQTNIKEVTRTGQVTGGAARVPGWVNADVTVALSCAASIDSSAVNTGIYAGEDDAPFITVTTTVDYESLFAGMGVIDSSYHLTATQQAPVMGI